MQRSQIHWVPRALTCMDQVTGFSATVAPQIPQLTCSSLTDDSVDPLGDVPSYRLMMEPDEPQPDPHYLELLRGNRLPNAYMPPAMVGPQKRWVRVAAAVIIACFLTATSFGICLTYGVPDF